ncbi:MAG: aldehyde ferredoxin oxidoreductase C-terminal domain-containing protein [Deltaproteobacteria bacterium]|nr:aldehyde ferredoxin oxidoreductase C-terminal domain-containing protein [Deltaproteobacteria bacterium]
MAGRGHSSIRWGPFPDGGAHVEGSGFVDHGEEADRYYRIRGFDRNGVPTPETLEGLGIPAGDSPGRGPQAAR